MTNQRTRLFLASLCLLLFVSAFASGQAWTGILDPSRAVDWSKAGVSGGIPARSTICATLNPGATASAINSAIASCPDEQVVQLTAGTYSLSGGIIFAGRNNITLRGAGPAQTILKFTAGTGCNGNGADVCFQGTAYYDGSTQVLSGGANACSWTGGYAQGSTVITLSSCGGAPPVGAMLILDQANDTSDTGGVYVCTSNCNVAGKVDNNGRTVGGALHSQAQVVKITAVSGSGSGPYQVTISPGLYANNWRSSRNPGVFWPGQVQRNGIENLTVDHSGTPSSIKAGTYFYGCYDCWMKNIRSIKSWRNHIWSMWSAHIAVVDSYFYQTQDAAQESYGFEAGITSDDLIQNNIWQQVTSPFETDSASGNVYAYNYSTGNLYTPALISVSQVKLSSNVATVTGTLQNSVAPLVGQAVYISGTKVSGGQFNVQGVIVTAVSGLRSKGSSGSISFALTGPDVSATSDSGAMAVNGSWMQTSDSEHGTGSHMNLFEGNVMNGLVADTYWGTSSVSTFFRNYLLGWQPGETLNTNAIFIGPYSRGYNLVGNVLGKPGYHKQYEISSAAGSTGQCWTSIYSMGWTNPGSGCKNSSIPGDPLTRSTLLRWGNYDVVSGTPQWSTSEIPTTATPYINANPVPSTRTLPPSMYMTSAPSWFSTPWGATSWPVIGPDVTGGADPSGMAYPNPAQSCYAHTAKDSSGVAQFDANTCYNTSSSSLVPATGLSATAK